MEEPQIAGIPSKIPDYEESENVKFIQHKGEWIAVEVEPFIWRWFFFGLWMSAFWVIPSTASIEGFWYGPEYSEIGVMICWLWPLTAVVTSICGLGLGNKALMTGALVGMAISPLLWFMGCMVVAP